MIKLANARLDKKIMESMLSPNQDQGFELNQDINNFIIKINDKLILC
jgi:uncharacterized FlaG/YvyC family protein